MQRWNEHGCSPDGAERNPGSHGLIEPLGERSYNVIAQRSGKDMGEYLAKVTAKGQMTLPAGVRDALGVGPGGYVRLEATRDGVFVMTAGSRASVLSGLIPYQGPARSIDEIRSGSRATFDK
jgi:AbrB family looped-hinge helix DNA binding protein